MLRAIRRRGVWFLAQGGGRLVRLPHLTGLLRSTRFDSARVGSGLVRLLLRNQTADTLGQKRSVERLFEGVVEPQREGLVTRLVAGQC